MSATKKSQPSLLTDAQIAALNNLGNSSTSVTGTKAVDAALVNNSELGLKDSSGKLLPANITVAQLQSVLADSKNKYNSATIENLKQIAAATVLPKTATLSPTGTISPTEINAIKSIASQGYAAGSVGKPVSLLNTAKAIKDGTIGGVDNEQTTFSRTTLDQPNIEASKSTINDIFLNYLGRSATEKEIAQYTQKYLNYAAKNPSGVSSGVTTYQNVQVPTSSGGTSNRLLRGNQSETNVNNNLTEQEFLKNQVRQSGEYNAFTAAGTAFDMMTAMAKKDTGAM